MSDGRRLTLACRYFGGCHLLQNRRGRQAPLHHDHWRAGALPVLRNRDRAPARVPQAGDQPRSRPAQGVLRGTPSKTDALFAGARAVEARLAEPCANLCLRVRGERGGKQLTECGRGFTAGGSRRLEYRGSLPARADVKHGGAQFLCAIRLHDQGYNQELLQTHRPARLPRSCESIPA